MLSKEKKSYIDMTINNPSTIRIYKDGTVSVKLMEINKKEAKAVDYYTGNNKEPLDLTSYDAKTALILNLIAQGKTPKFRIDGEVDRRLANKRQKQQHNEV